MSIPDLSVVIAPGLKLANPVIAASGTCGYGDDWAELVDIQKLGAIICKGTTLHARDGNPQPRIIEVAAGILNSIGLQNIGVEALIREKAPLWASWQVPVIVNIAGETIDEYAALAAKLEGVAGISALEVNISCPNVKQGGMQFGTSPAAAAEVTAAVKSASSLSVIVKLSPNVKDICAIALAAEEAGADALSLINTLSGMAIDIKKREPKLGNIIGGLSGPAIKPVALGMVYQVCGCVKVPVIGCGGIMTAEDALEFIMAGALAVQVGTANLVEPAAVLDIICGIEKYLSANGIQKMTDLCGAARK
ncbi:MAG: dihydroorotate dehydrogenase [Dehalococcoidia bacterium]|nr:dihydroorotate dehydrogenase [Dehalococcoidia bacterium]